MAEILIKVADYVNADPVKDRRGVHKRGDIINIKPDGWSNSPNWPQSQYPYSRSGKFILVKCPEVTVAECLAWRENWKDDFAYEIISQNPQQGLYVVRVYEQNPGAAGQNNLTRAKIETYLTGWGCINITFTTNSCQFTFSLWAAVRSKEFWERDVSSITFTLVSYNSTTGIGQISANCNVIIEQFVITHADDPQAETKIRAEIERKIPERGGTVIGWTDRTLIFEIERSNILTRFREDVKEKAEQVYLRHRYNVASADVDVVIAAGGVMTITKTQFLAKLKDKMLLTAKKLKA
jgi:hypothetical protein